MFMFTGGGPPGGKALYAGPIPVAGPGPTPEAEPDVFR
jgi:hypothetical protein